MPEWVSCLTDRGRRADSHDDERSVWQLRCAEDVGTFQWRATRQGVTLESGVGLGSTSGLGLLVILLLSGSGLLVVLLLHS